MIYEKDFEYTGSLRIEEDMNTSSNVTPNIKCNYFLEVLVYHDMYFQKEPISIMLPFHVNPMNNILKEMPKLPAVWEPIESSIYVFSADNRVSTFIGSEGMPSIISPDIFNNT